MANTTKKEYELEEDTFADRVVSRHAELLKKGYPYSTALNMAINIEAEVDAQEKKQQDPDALHEAQTKLDHGI